MSIAKLRKQAPRRDYLGQNTTPFIEIRMGADIYSLGKTQGFGRGDYYREEVTELLKHGYTRTYYGEVDVPGFGNVDLYKWILR